MRGEGCVGGGGWVNMVEEGVEDLAFVDSADGVELLSDCRLFDAPSTTSQTHFSNSSSSSSTTCSA